MPGIGHTLVSEGWGERGSTPTFQVWRIHKTKTATLKITPADLPTDSRAILPTGAGGANRGEQGRERAELAGREGGGRELTGISLGIRHTPDVSARVSDVKGTACNPSLVSSAFDLHHGERRRNGSAVGTA